LTYRTLFRYPSYYNKLSAHYFGFALGLLINHAKEYTVTQASYNIVMFAYNEANNLANSVTAVANNCDNNLHKFYLMANGCTDKTVEVAEALKRKLNFDKMEVINIELGDKCNAWNHYVHNVADEEPLCHFFVDADVIFSQQCFPLLVEKIAKANDSCHIIAGMPLSGRNLEFYQSLVTERFCFFGNLYGMHQRYLKLVKEKNFKLPIGLNWIDSFLTKAANTDIQFIQRNLPDRVIHLPGVGFHFESLSPFNWDDIKLYKNRIARYELGKIQETYLDDIAANKWPATMHEINLLIAESFEQKTEALGLVKKYLVKKRLGRLIAKGK
jgi:glycosyltransferase involved in cell wall biosynthesis